MSDLTKVFLSPERFVAHENGDVLLDILPEDLEHVLSDVQPRMGTIRGAMRGSFISLRLLQSAHRFHTSEHTTSITWYASDDDLAAFRWAIEEAQAAAAQFGAPPC